MTSSRFSRSFGPRDSDQTEQEPTAASSARPCPDDSAAEVILSNESGTQQGVCAKTRQAVRPCGVFVPEKYEPNYAYPLIVWLHETGRSERDIVEVLPQISMRNYLGLAMRGTVSVETSDNSSPGYGWSRSERRRLLFQEELHASVGQLRKEFHINGERIFLAGAGDGGTLAWDLFLARPEWFAGVAVLDGRFPWRRRPLRHYHELRGKHVFLSTDAEDPAGVCQAEEVGRLLYTAGLEVSVRCHVPGPRRPRSLMRNIDYWIMQSIGGCR